MLMLPSSLPATSKSAFQLALQSSSVWGSHQRHPPHDAADTFDQHLLEVSLESPCGKPQLGHRIRSAAFTCRRLIGGESDGWE